MHIPLHLLSVFYSQSNLLRLTRIKMFRGFFSVQRLRPLQGRKVDSRHFVPLQSHLSRNFANLKQRRTKNLVCTGRLDVDLIKIILRSINTQWNVTPRICDFGGRAGFCRFLQSPLSHRQCPLSLFFAICSLFHFNLVHAEGSQLVHGKR